MIHNILIYINYINLNYLVYKPLKSGFKVLPNIFPIGVISAQLRLSWVPVHQTRFDHRVLARSSLAWQFVTDTFLLSSGKKHAARRLRGWKFD